MARKAKEQEAEPEVAVVAETESTSSSQDDAASAEAISTETKVTRLERKSVPDHETAGLLEADPSWMVANIRPGRGGNIHDLVREVEVPSED